jgi:hypothetical protein
MRTKLINEWMVENDKRFVKEVNTYFFIRDEKNIGSKDIRPYLKMFDLDFKRNLLIPKKEEKFSKDTKWNDPYKKINDGRLLLI